MNRLTEKPETLFDAFYSRFVLRDLFAKILPGLMLILAVVTPLLPCPFNVISEVPVALWVIVFSIAWVTGFAIQSLGEACGFIRLCPFETSEKLTKLPFDKILLDHTTNKIRYDSDKQLLIFKGVMSEGEKTQLLKLPTDKSYKKAITALSQKSLFTDEKERFKYVMKLHNTASLAEKRQYERFIVIKEACGNSYVALLLSLVSLMAYAAHGILELPAHSWVGLVTIAGAIYLLRRMHFIHVTKQQDYLHCALEFH